MKFTTVLIIAFVLITSCASGSDKSNQIEQSAQISVILDTDMGNDIDDALALDMIYKYIDQGKMNLLAIMNNKDSQFSTEFIDIMNTWYGYPNIPIGKLKDGVTIDDYVNYAQNVCKLQEGDKPMFERTLKDYDSLTDAHILYRKILAQQPDSSVTVISIGFSTNIARLLDTPADDYSPLTGKELVAAKVKLLSVMGGCFTENPRKEFNIINDVQAAQKLFAEWPTEIVVAPFELGAKVQFPAKVIENDFDWGMNHPLVKAYLNYRPMPYNRATWDLMSVLYVAEADGNYFSKSVNGKIAVTDEGITVFEEQEKGKHVYLMADSTQTSQIKDYFINLIKTKPKSVSKNHE